MTKPTAVAAPGPEPDDAAAKPLPPGRSQQRRKPAPAPAGPPEIVLDAKTLERLIGVALNPNEGDALELGGRTFRRAFLKLAAERDMTRLLVALLKDRELEGDALADLFLEAQEDLAVAAAIIVADYDGIELADALAWIENTRSITTDDLIGFVGGQLDLQKMVPLLGKLLRASGLLGALAQALLPRTTSTR